MTGLGHQDVTMFFLALATLLGAARIAGELALRLRQPAVVGELLAGVALGPTVFGALAPAAQGALFPTSGPAAVALSGFATLAIALFLLVAGIEIDLSAVWKQSRSVAIVAAVGIVVPFATGFGAGLAAPRWFGAADIAPVLFALFLGTALAITALPVIARILLDLKLFHSAIAVTIVSSAILNDLAGWIIFAFVLAFMGIGQGVFSPGATAAITVAFAAAMLTAGRWAVNRALPWVQAHSEWPAGVLAFAFTLALLSAALTEWIGVHAIFGAFLFGVALGDSGHLRRRTRTSIEQMVSSIFAPVFFASIGLKADFIRHFDLPLVLTVLALGSVTKIVGCRVAARWAGFDRRESWAIGFGMNARGAMEIVLGLLALESGLIGERLFVALVILALATSMTSGTLIQWCFGQRREASFMKHVSARTFAPGMSGDDRFEAVRKLAAIAAEAGGVDPVSASEAVVRHERLYGSAVGQSVAIPHARIPGLTQPVIALGLDALGIEFDTPDGRPVHVVIVLLSPMDDPALHLSILADIGRVFHNPETAAHLARSVRTMTELRAFLRIEAGE